MIEKYKGKMGKIHKSLLLLSLVTLLYNCDSNKKASKLNDNSLYLKDSTTFKFRWSLDEILKKYADSINGYSNEDKKIPYFIRNYNSSLKDDFSTFDLLHNSKESKKKKIYYEIFNRSDSNSLTKIKLQLQNQLDLNKHDSIIIDLLK